MIMKTDLRSGAKTHLIMDLKKKTVLHRKSR